MAYGHDTTEGNRIAWLAQCIRDVLILGAGIALALPLILPFA